MSAIGGGFMDREVGDDDDDPGPSPNGAPDATSLSNPGLPPTIEAVLRTESAAAPQRTYKWGFDELDELTGGLRARQLTVVAGPTGSGKTGLAITMAANFRKVAPVLYVSTEASEVAARAAAPILRTTPGEILAHSKRPDDAADAVRDWPFRVMALDTFVTPKPLEAIEVAARTMQTEGTIPIIIVDYFQHLGSDDGDRRMSVSAVANGLRRLSQGLDTAVIGVSSVSRAYYGKQAKAMAGASEGEDPRDWLAAAKESGDIEYAAAVFVYLDTSTKVNIVGESAARLVVAKARRGRRGFVGLSFHGPSGLFTAEMRSLG